MAAGAAPWGLALALALCAVPLACLPEPDVWACDTRSDCRENERCVEGFCEDDIACLDSSDCQSGFTCIGATCTPTVGCTPGFDPRCTPYGCNAASSCHKDCSTDNDCAPGNGCLERQCIPVDCSLTRPCGQGYGCQSGTCVAEARTLGSSCTDDDECASQHCCLEPELGLICMNGCADGLHGWPCTFGAECQSGSCVNGQCDSCGPDCPPLFCDVVECGIFRGSDCGGCDGSRYCENNRCVAACANIECGEDHGINCGACEGDRVCFDGNCVEPTCTPGAVFCHSNGSDVIRCLDGIATTVALTCDRTLVCREGTTECAPYVCAPNQGFCEGDRYFVCDEYGKRTTAPARNCKDESRQCLPAVGCVVAQEDTVVAPAPQSVGDQTLCGNVYAVTAEATLASIVQQQGTSSAFEISWFLYRALELTGPYELAVPRIIAPAQRSAGDVASPLLNLPLEAGHFYFIGFAADGADFLADPDAETPQSVAFGTLIQGACSPDGLPQTLERIMAVGVVPQTLTTY